MRIIGLSEPKLRVSASGYGGSGYFNPFTGQRVIGVTTALGVIDKPALRQWVADQTAAYAAVNAEQLLARSEEQAFNMLRFYHSRTKSSDFDDPVYETANAHTGVLDDAADLGTKMHEFFEAELNGWFQPDLYRDEEVQMAEQLLIWLAENEVDVHATEATVFGGNYGGTADLFANVNGVATCLDLKTSRNIWPEHHAQLAALGTADTLAKEVSKGTPGAKAYTRTKAGEKVTDYWVAEEVPPIQQYAILHLRPDDYDNNGNFIPAFCELKVAPQQLINIGYEEFQASVVLREAQRARKQIEKELAK